MKEFDYSGDVKVNGAVMGAFLAAFGPYLRRGEQVLCKYFKVDKIIRDVNSLYPLSEFMKAMEEFQNQFGLDFMKKIGNAIHSNAVFPPGIDSVEKGMAMINTAYYMNHKTEPGEIGSYTWKQEGSNKGVMLCDNPYPCAFDFGIIENISQKFAPFAKVTHDDSQPCRHKGGDSCTYIVEW